MKCKIIEAEQRPAFPCMPSEITREIQLEIAHVLLIDIVGYSKLSINEQQVAIDELTGIFRSTEQFQTAEASPRSIMIATGVLRPGQLYS